MQCMKRYVRTKQEEVSVKLFYYLGVKKVSEKDEEGVVKKEKRGWMKKVQIKRKVEKK